MNSNVFEHEPEKCKPMKRFINDNNNAPCIG